MTRPHPWHAKSLPGFRGQPFYDVYDAEDRSVTAFGLKDDMRLMADAPEMLRALELWVEACSLAGISPVMDSANPLEALLFTTMYLLRRHEGTAPQSAGLSVAECDEVSSHG